MKHYGIDAVPFKHRQMDEWRENFKGVQYLHEPTNLIITGAVDDIWESPKGDDSWVEEIIKKAHQCLMSDKIPPASGDCDYCGYREAAREIER